MTSPTIDPTIRAGTNPSPSVLPSKAQTVTINAGPNAPIKTPSKSFVAQLETVPFPCSAFHFSDSGTNSRKKNVNSAGVVPRIISSRQPLFETSQRRSLPTIPRRATVLRTA